MGMFERFMEKASLADESEEYLDDEGYEYENYDEEAPVSSIRAVTPAEEVSRIATCWPRTFADIQTFADEFRKDLPVILNLSQADDAARQRIADFALGVCYGRGGNLNQISDDVLLMTPYSVRMEEHRADGTNRLGR
ncbi:cell division protein SepF [Flaviflexus huanghaiensis]|uniref:cell division protein SepF n=1 Tax=Flaviflexus huanghaiensis TaxID=1111473 RepID=UPI0015F7E3F2|nr:cell division protein SepF [Flaviflexus huanghaiensis]